MKRFIITANTVVFSDGDKYSKVEVTKEGITIQANKIVLK